MSGLPREVLKWLQSLDLHFLVRKPKWDFSNGLLIAEIFSWYYPQDITMHSYSNGASIDLKLRNWSLLKNFFKRHNLDIPEDLIEGTIHCKQGAALLLIRRIYEILTNRQLKDGFEGNVTVDFTDSSYQSNLPLHARSTAAKAIKNNMTITEMKADTSLVLNQQKAQIIVSQHLENRRTERENDPKRFGIRPTLGEKCLRRPPGQTNEYTRTSLIDNGKDMNRLATAEKEQLQPISSEGGARSTVTEIQVNQTAKYATTHQPVVLGQ